MFASWKVGAALGIAAALAGCGGDAGALLEVNAQSCMVCHNASLENDYSGPGIENPHPFGTASNLLCTECHGGNGDGEDLADSHVPPPPEIGDEENLENDAEAYFNRLTLAGVDKFPDYVVDGVTYTALDWLQFVNPGDLRVVTQGRSCGVCHEQHADTVAMSPLATSTGVMSNATYAIGQTNQVPAQQDLYLDTAADLAFRPVQDPTFVPGAGELGDVGELLEFPVFSEFGQTGGNNIHNNPAYDFDELDDDIDPATNQVIPGSPLANLFHEQVAFTCGDCHLGSAGANNRYADFRSSGCTACHMPYGKDGRTQSTDPNIDKNEPLDPDDIDEPERSHVRKHQILSVAKTVPGVGFLPGIDDYACVGCHQGSNRTVLQYWGIRLDQNEDLRRGVQYPAQPDSFINTGNDPRLFDPQVGNNTFNGRNRHQYIRFEDYDGDGRDDTPADVHYDAGMGCIDCHGSFDLHGDVGGPTKLVSRMEQHVAIACESCHGSANAYAITQPGTTYAGAAADVAVDAAGKPLRHVTKAADGHYYLTSRLTGDVHFIPQTRDVTVDTGVENPFTQEPVYSVKASYAMGRADGQATTGLGPLQAGTTPNGFSHSDTMDCAACHSSWTNTCMGCHLSGDYNTGNNFSNITGERIVFRQRTADFTYQSPVYFQLGVNSRGEIAQTSSNTKVFFAWEDRQNNLSQVFAFSDRTGGGNAPSGIGALSHNAFMAHSIRGKATPQNEGARYCVACHLTDGGLASFGQQAYTDFWNTMQSRNYGALNFGQLRDQIGLNPGNQLDSPLFVHMAAGLGSGLFLFDDEGRPLNPLDQDANRKGAGGQAPASYWDPLLVSLDLDRVVEPSGVSNATSTHALLDPSEGGSLRNGAADPGMAGPLGATLVERLAHPTNGIVLDSWLDADGDPQGGAPTILTPP